MKGNKCKCCTFYTGWVSFIENVWYLNVAELFRFGNFAQTSTLSIPNLKIQNLKLWVSCLNFSNFRFLYWGSSVLQDKLLKEGIMSFYSYLLTIAVVYGVIWWHTHTHTECRFNHDTLQRAYMRFARATNILLGSSNMPGGISDVLHM